MLGFRPPSDQLRRHAWHGHWPRDVKWVLSARRLVVKVWEVLPFPVAAWGSGAVVIQGGRVVVDSSRLQGVGLSTKDQHASCQWTAWFDILQSLTDLTGCDKQQ